MIAGPTAAGKTALAVSLARALQTEIISADSRQFYREMSIGTAKPGAEELREVRHHFIDNKSVTELYGAGHFATDARAVLEELFEKHNVVILAGGSGLYIDALLKGVDDFEEVPEDLRSNLSAEYREKGLGWLQDKVRTVDPSQFEQMDRSNPQRLLRVLEVSLHTGKPYSTFLKQREAALPFEVIPLLIDPGRGELYDRINSRVDEMVKKGLVEEARRLYPLRHHNSLKTVGYQELFDHFEGRYSLEEAVAKIRQHTRNYAKRQMTWFRNRGNYRTFHPAAGAEILRYIQERMHG